MAMARAITDARWITGGNGQKQRPRREAGADVVNDGAGSAQGDARLLGLKFGQGHLHCPVQFLQLCELLLEFA